MQLPFVLQSAQTMKAAVAFLEPFMDKEDSDGSGKGKFIIATVKGDVHDIGKNLVDIILSNNGYKVINLGIKQPVENIIEAYQEHKADCIAMSGLLVKSTAFMKDNLEVFNEKGITVPVILGGAALTPKFVYQDCQNTYKGKVIYGKDAFADLHFMDKLMPAKASGNWDDLKGFLDEEESPLTPLSKGGIDEKESSSNDTEIEVIEIDTKRSEFVSLEIERPTPPFWGTKLLTAEEIPIEEVFNYLDLQALFVGQWQFRKPKDQSREEYDQFLQETVYPILDNWKQRVINENLLQPTVIYGYFPCLAEGNSLSIYNPETLDLSQEIATFEFPRQRKNKRLCIADFFLPKDHDLIPPNPPLKGGDRRLVDVFPMQAVTVGEIATEYAKKLFEANDYTNYLYYHGMAVQIAEALAEWTHARVRKELGFANLEPNNIRDILQQRYQGSRYSFGYPACPNIQDQFKQLELLETNRINMYMDESEQLYPEQSTTAIICYHPMAKYFSV
jgi:5-methyltetrahydrofolate--homocysteine methyltransferase